MTAVVNAAMVYAIRINMPDMLGSLRILAMKKKAVRLSIQPVIRSWD
jgi:hypothetical protein